MRSILPRPRSSPRLVRALSSSFVSLYLSPSCQYLPCRRLRRSPRARIIRALIAASAMSAALVSTSALPAAASAPVSAVASSAAIPTPATQTPPPPSPSPAPPSPAPPSPAPPPPAPRNPTVHVPAKLSKRARRKLRDSRDQEAGLQPPPPFVPKKWNVHALAPMDQHAEVYFNNRMNLSVQQSNERNHKVNTTICNLIGRTCNFDFAYLGTTVENPLGPHHPPIPNLQAPLPYAPVSTYPAKDQAREERRRLQFCKVLHQVRVLMCP
jgi:hypothetical protein